MSEPSQSGRAARRTRRWLVPVLGVGCLTAGLLATLAIFTPHPQQLLAQQRQSELAAAPDDEVLPRLREIAELGDAGIAVLVQSLGSGREVVARGAQRVLREEVDRWQLLPPDVSSPLVAGLARSLAQHTGDLPRSARGVPADLATQILLWPLDDHLVQTEQVIADCETVLRASAGAGSSPRLAGAAEFAASEKSSLAAVHSPLDDLPAEVAEAPPLPVRDSSAPRDETSMQGRAREANLDRPPHPLPLSGGRLIPAGTPSIGAANQAAEISLGARSADLIAGIGDLEHVVVMSYLHARDPQVAHAAQAELTQRGFTTEQIDVARRMTDPDVDTRRELARALPRIAGINARPWLFWLSRDADPDVRIEALTILATVQDPAVRKQVLELLEGESDPRVVQRAKAAGLR